ncbi:MAG: hypothetical protein QOH47_975 [Sphingomonadales bacterium]|jgi:hypothetical protein|nr:hypothetical protein [Sphingomonadales bacterium]
MSASATSRIRELNDAFRTKGPIWASTLGLARPDEDGWYITDGVQEFGPLFVLEAIGAVQRTDSFDADNDPHGEHDFGSVTVADERIFWKIDYYDLRLRYGSDDPANPEITRRVITIMLASEY